MKDGTRDLLLQWGFDPRELETIDQMVYLDVETDFFTLALASATYRKVSKLMADVTALEAAIDSLTTTEASVATALGDLRDEVASLEAGAISQEKIDSLTAKVTNAVTALGNAENPPAPEEPAPEQPAPEENPPAEG